MTGAHRFVDPRDAECEAALMFRSLASLAVVVVSVALSGCCIQLPTVGKKDSTIAPGGQTYTPPTGSTGTGGGGGGSGGGSGGGTSSTPPPPLTSMACASSSDCPYWYCRCSDSMVVNAAFCYQGYCTEASAICPDACTRFNHGSWTGSYGGPGSTSGTGGGTGSGGGTGASGGSSGGCTSGSDCPALDCTCHDGSLVSTQSCSNGSCDGPGEACPSACVEYGGYP